MKNRLREFREKNNLSQQAMANKMTNSGYKISKATISMYESGERIPTEKKWNDLANFFNTNVDTLKGKISNSDEVIKKLIDIIHDSFFSKDQSSLQQNIKLYLKLTHQENVPDAFYKKEQKKTLNKNIFNFWKNCFDFLFFNDKFISSLINENSEDRLKLILENEINKQNKYLLSKTKSGKGILKLKESNVNLYQELISFATDNKVFNDDLEKVLNLDHIKIFDSNGKDITNENLLGSLDEEITRLTSLKNYLVEMKINKKNDKQ